MRVGGARPPPFITFTLNSKVAVYAPAEWADTLTLFPYIWGNFAFLFYQCSMCCKSLRVYCIVDSDCHFCFIIHLYTLYFFVLPNSNPPHFSCLVPFKLSPSSSLEEWWVKKINNVVIVNFRFYWVFLPRKDNIFLCIRQRWASNRMCPQIRKFIGPFPYLKSANFLCVPASPLVANPQILYD